MSKYGVARDEPRVAINVDLVFGGQPRTSAGHLVNVDLNHLMGEALACLPTKGGNAFAPFRFGSTS